MIGKTYYRYIWLLNTLLEKELTYEEIAKLWKQHPMAKDGLPIRTFHDHREGVREMFGVEIKCRRSQGNVYYVENAEALKQRDLKEWLLKKYSIPEDFFMFNTMKDRVLLEEIPLGGEMVPSIINAMKEGVEVEVDYQRFWENMKTFSVQPYALKVYAHRWYLLGLIAGREGLRNMALDRVNAMRLTKRKFSMPEGFSAWRFYANTIGIFTRNDLPVSEVRIRAFGNQANYIQEAPLHKSQSTYKVEGTSYTDFKYKLCITPELISTLLSMGDNIEVLEPQELRDEIIARLKASLERYQ